MIYVGIDDTDGGQSPDTAQLVKDLFTKLSDRYRCIFVIQHQLLIDERLTYSNNNRSMSLLLEYQKVESINNLVQEIRDEMLIRCAEESQPGLCVTEEVTAEVMAFGKQCQHEVIQIQTAWDLAAVSGIYLEGLSEKKNGVIGALASVGLAASGEDGQVLQVGEWQEDISGIQSISILQERGVEVRSIESGKVISQGFVDVGKSLLPNYRSGKMVLYVIPQPGSELSEWQAVRFH